MKFKFKIQQYQTDAVERTVEVFAGQPSYAPMKYRMDLGKRDGKLQYAGDDDAYCNANVELSQTQLLDNIRKVQAQGDIKLSDRLLPGIGKCSLDIEMETGTGKTYVYIKTMFELNKRYGWSKFIVVVPSIAIREGVGKSFRMLEDHFMEHYGKKARWFIYNSSRLKSLDDFSSDAGINVMIINTQAFATSLNEAKNTAGKSGDKAARIIYSKRDDFASRRPIDVIAANRPIIIMDEPQKMEGEATQTALKRFMPLFILNYSATHKTKHNTVYALDALDAYNQKLVKKIQVKGFEVKNLKGASSYLYIDSIILSKTEPPMAKIDLEVNTATGIRRKSIKFGKGDKLQSASGLAQYAGFEITEINPYTDTVTFLNDITLRKGEVFGDTNELDMQRVQIRETIISHFEKERELFARGIKTLSLFFIDEVAKYKSYGEDGEVEKGVFWKIFEEEYTNILNENLSLFDSAYQQYLRRFDASEIHNGYFSIDKKGRVTNGEKVSRKTGLEEGTAAYDLILKNKERLLSFDEPTRFIFSHSALREGWDNPNVFQICTLRHANSETAKRQEVGRGLRICVDANGNRMDFETLGESVHELNKLTVIANESYSSFVKDLQDKTREALRDRPTKADEAYFIGKLVFVGDEKHAITADEANSIRAYLWENDYIDDKGQVTELYKSDSAGGNLAQMSRKIAPMADGIQLLIRALYDESVAIDNMFEDGNATVIKENKLNDNFSKTEFQALWKEINHKYAYTVHYNSNELIEKAAISINANLEVNQLRYVVVTGEQDSVDAFGNTTSTSKQVATVSTSTVKYDLVGEIAKGATLTRRTVVEILKKLRGEKLVMFQNNPEEFIRNVVKLIKEQKASMIVEHISYNLIEGKYDSTIFTQEKHSQKIDKAYSAQKHIMDYVFSDSDGERDFASALDGATEVCVYAKLPRSFQIPTPVGNYAPDWAIAFNKGTVKHIFFVAETKGSLDSMELRGVEKAKIACARKLFNDISTINVRYGAVASYEDLLNKVQGI
ncbi:MAG: DEAD/DEAH box helicase family protein [Bacteroidaceae bacterium]|nr:DEAD/DEAH box helicase family protein [Bacteroidaceae bacterium]